MIDDTPTYSTQDSSYPHSNGGIATARIIRVINPKDMIVHRVVHNDDRPYPLRTSSYYNGQVRYAPIQPPKSGNNERSHSYSVSIEKHVHVGRRPLSPQRVYSSSTDHRSSLPNSDLSHPLMSASMYNYRPLICRQMNSPSLMSSSFHEQSNRVEPPMSSWSQSVRRLNTEYASTIHALQQAKESLEQIHPQPMDSISKYANLVAKGINDLSNGEQKRSMGVTFCLTASMAKAPTLLPTTPTIFSKPKVIRPVELETFTPSIPASIPKLEPVIVAKEKTEPIANIIKKFNNLNHSTSNGKPSLTKTYELEEIPYDSPPPLALSSSDSSSSISEDSTRSTTSTSDENLVHPPDHTGQQEETTYTVETFYTNDVQSTARLLPLPQVVVIRENTTEEQFNLAQEKEEASKEVPTLNTPLLTYLNLAMKQTKTNEEEEEEK